MHPKHQNYQWGIPILLYLAHECKTQNLMHA